MSELPPFRRFLKRFHPEAIPRLGSIAYNWISRSRIFQIQYEFVAGDVVARRSEGRLLDVGTGPGWLLIKLHQRLPAFELVGIDISPGMVAEARHNMNIAGISGEVTIREGNAGSLPFEEGSFDVVVSTGSFHHWKEPVDGLNECYRVLRPGGCGLIYDLVADTPRAVLEQTKKEHGRFARQLFWLHGFEEPFYTEQAFLRLGKASDFKSAGTRYVGLLCCLELERSA